MNTTKKVRDTDVIFTKTHPVGLRTIMELFDVGPGIAMSVLSITGFIIFGAILYFIHSAPPSTITISSGPEGSTFQKNALKYAAILEANGVKVNVLTSKGSLENLQRLSDPNSHVDLGVVQAGLATPGTENLVSLGSISYQPILIFYKGPTLELLSGLANKKVAVGPEGSGTRKFALALLAANGIKESGTTTLMDWEGEEAAQGLADGKIDAAFVMSESSSSDILKKLMHSTDIQLYNFKQASAYSRKVDYLNILDLPQGAIDIGADIPAHDVTLVGPMVELVATKSLHPALSDVILEAAAQIHNRPGLFQKRGEFPTPIEHAIRISDDANRYYKSGKSLLYRMLPFWMASFTSRVVVVFLPMLFLLVPTLKSVPAFFRWRTQTKIHRRYRELLTLEQEYLTERDPERLAELRKHFDQIEEAVNQMKVRARFADQIYGLRGHIDFVRQLLDKKRA